MQVNGIKVKKARLQIGMTQEELAEHAKVSLRTVQRIENNAAMPRANSLKAICNVLEIELSEFVTMSSLEKNTNLVERGLRIFFLLTLNCVFMIVIGYLTIDSNANFNSKIGALIIAVLAPYLIVLKTPKLTGTVRLIQFGLGFLVYVLLAFIFISLKDALLSGLVPFCLVAIAVLFFGKAKN